MKKQNIEAKLELNTNSKILLNCILIIFISPFHFINISGPHSYLLTFERTENETTLSSPKSVMRTAGINKPKLKFSLWLDQNT